jgi:hypothetical protein
MLVDRVTKHGIVTAKTAASIVWQAEAETVERLHVAQWTAAYHRALAGLPGWARQILDLKAQNRSHAEISAITGYPLRTLSRRIKEAENLLRTRILWPNGAPSSTDIIGASSIPHPTTQSEPTVPARALRSA